MEIIIGLAVVVLVVVLVFKGLKRMNAFIEDNERRAYLMTVLHNVEAKAELDKETGHR